MHVFIASCVLLLSGHVDVVRFLLEYSASVDDVDKSGKTAADLASERGHLRVVQLIDEWTFTNTHGSNTGPGSGPEQDMGQDKG